MNLPLGSKTCIPAMVFLWTYAVFKFLVGFNVLRAYGINPWIFLLLDTVTVPTYIIGWSHLIASMGEKNQGFRIVLKWSVVTFVSSTLPYLYAAWAGRQSHSKQVWFILIIILIVILVGQLQKLWRTKLSG